MLFTSFPGNNRRNDMRNRELYTQAGYMRKGQIPLTLDKAAKKSWMNMLNLDNFKSRGRSQSRMLNNPQPGQT